jgi:hypothetical protein
MSKRTHHRTASEQRYWDDLTKALAAVCVDLEKPAGCAHLIRELADELLEERRDSAAKDKH